MTDHKVTVWLSHLGPDGRALPRGERNDRPWKWFFKCTCGAGGMSWSWWREYDVLSSSQTREQWIEDNGEPVGGALIMALEHVGLDSASKAEVDAALASIKEVGHEAPA